MDYEYAYVFSLNGEVAWSAETKESLIENRSSIEKNLITDFVNSNPDPGSFIIVDGSMIFRTRRI